jgi:hypothetical protein
MTQKISAFALLLISVGCDHMGSSREEVFYSAEDDDAGGQFWCRFEAPLIVAGRISDVQYDSRSSAVGAYGTPLYKVHLRIEVEETLKGDVRAPGLQVMGFVMRSPGPRARKGELFAADFWVGQRKLFFLRRQGELYRLARDNYDYSIRLRTGRHDPPKYQPESARARAAYLMLVPGRGIETDNWDREFDRNINYAPLLIYPEQVVEIVKSNAAAIAQHSKDDQWKETLAAFRIYIPSLKSIHEAEANLKACLDFGQREGTQPSAE